MKAWFIVFCLSLAALAQPYEAGTVQGKEGRTMLRDKPNLKSQTLSSIANGQLVMILGKQGDFYRVLKLHPIKGRRSSVGYVYAERVAPTLKRVLGAACSQGKEGWSSLRSGPSKSAPSLARVQATDWFVVIEEGDFCKVVTANNQQGYIHKSRIRWLLPKK